MIVDIYLIALGFILSVIFTKLTIIREKTIGLLALDLHKDEKIYVPKIGGIAIAIAFTVTMITAYFLKWSLVYLVILLSFLISASIGFIDDQVSLPPWRKIILGSFGAIPLLMLISWNPITILFLFAAVGVVSNWTNMLAGFNGLEIGLGAIMLFFLSLNTISENSSLSLLIYSAVLLGFLVFNKYPANIFPGDTGTLPIGAVLVASTLLGAPLISLLILLIPHMIDSVLKFSTAGVMSSSDYKPSRSKKGYLIPGKSYLSLAKLIMRVRPLKEWQLVAIFWAIEIGLGIITLMI